VTEPVSLAEAKAFAVIDYDDQDVLLTTILTSAREDIEAELNFKLVPAEASFYANTTNDEEVFHLLPWARALSEVGDLVVNLIEDGEDDELMTIDEEYYFNGALKISEASRNRIEYSITPVVPSAIKEAIKMLFAYRVNHRADEAQQNGFPADVEAKISRYRMIWL
jgi:hypothetical protein